MGQNKGVYFRQIKIESVYGGKNWRMKNACTMLLVQGTACSVSVTAKATEGQ